MWNYKAKIEFPIPELALGILKKPQLTKNNDTTEELSLKFFFDNLDLSPIWQIIRHKYSLVGRLPYNPKAMFKALLLKEIRQIPSRRKLTDFLKKEKIWLKKLGFNEAPTHESLRRFIDKIGPETFEEIFKELVRQVGREIEIGKIVAVDSTSIKGYAKYWKNKKCSDPDASWGYSATKEWIFGYKVHIACDAELELPIGFTVTGANKHDSVEYPSLLKDLIRREIRPKVIIADAGYDTKENYFLALQYNAIPIIAFNRRKMKKEVTRDFEKDLPIPRKAELWKILYAKRGSVERINSRLKEELCLKAVKVRTLEKVRTHVALSLIAMLCIALVALKTGNGDLLASVNSFRF